MYQCLFVKYLWKDSEVREKKKRLYRILEREVTIPFVPNSSHEFTEGKWFSGKIERLVWDNKMEKFSIKVQDIIPQVGVSAELLLEVAQKQGWTDRTPE